MNMAMAVVTTVVVTVGSCEVEGEVEQDMKKGTSRVSFKAGKYDIAGPEDICGCMTFTDENNEPLDSPPGEILNGHGGGVVPPGAEGWQLELVPCEEFEGCVEALGAGGGPVPPPAPRGLGRLPGRTFHYLGLQTTEERILFFDFTVEAPDVAAARAKRDWVLEHVEGAPLPGGVVIDELQVYTPAFEGGELLGFEGLALDEEPIDTFSLDVNGVPEVSANGSQYLGNGYWGVPHAIGTTNLELSWLGTHNEFVARRSTANEPLIQSEVTLDWTPAQ